MERAGRVPGAQASARPEAGPTGRRLARFILERFPPASYGTLIGALVLCGTGAAYLDAGAPLRLGWSQVWAVSAAACAFLQLRVLDDLRDEATDRIGRPDRPVPRGLVTRAELRVLAAGAGIAGAVAAAAIGPAGFVCYGLAIAQVWLLDIAGRRRPAALDGMVTTALTHSAIVPTVLLVAWAAVADPALSVPLAATLALAWGAGLVLEVGRKTVTAAEERPGQLTYSAALGRPAALALIGAFLVVGAAGAGLLALSTGASPGIASLPLIAAVAASVVLVGWGAQVSTRTVRTVTPAAVLALLLWPALLGVGLR